MAYKTSSLQPLGRFSACRESMTMHTSREASEMTETASKDELLDRFHAARQGVDETNLDIRRKLVAFRSGLGPYPSPQEWLHLWQLEATIDRLRGELEEVSLGDLKSPDRRSSTAFAKASAALASTGEPSA